MLRIRKLVLAIAAASALSSGMAHALGLGELTLKSGQNQPLDAEIELLDVRDLTPAEVVPSLAPAEEFSKAGVERQAYLNDLTFTPVINPSGKSVLRVTSSQPLPAPMVKFLVQVMWPQGRLLRDYSVLIDASKFSPEAAQAASGVTPAVTAPARHTTVRRDTLWQIAAKARQGGSVQQTMLAIQALNPDAFYNGNINQLKVGQVLRLPDQQQIAAIPQGQAVKEVAEQYAAWREGRRLGPRARQLDATRRDAAGAAPARIAQQDNLKLVAPGGKGAAGDSKALADKLAMAEESLDTTRRDNAELKSRVADLQSQLDKLQRLIELKNDQLARLEAQSAAPASLPAPEQPAIDAQLQQAVPSEAVVSPAPAAVDTAPVAETPPAAVTPSDSDKMLDDLLGNSWLLALIAGSALLVLLLLLLLLARKRRAQQEAEKHMRMARALAEESDLGLGPDMDLPQSSFEGLEVSAPSVTLAPGVVAASAAAAAAAEVAPAYDRLDPESELELEPEFEPKPAPVVEPAPEPVEVPSPAPAAVVAPAVIAPAVQAPAEDAPAPNDDALLAEVDLSIARGRLNHAAELLEPAVEQAPERADLRLKLMEVYARQGDRDAFVGHERQLVANGQNHADVESLKQRYPAMLGVAAAGVSAAALAAELDAQYVQDLLQDDPQPEPEIELPGEDDLDSAFDLSLDDLEGLEGLEDLEGLEGLADLQIDDPQAPQATPPADIAALDDLDFDTLLQEQTQTQAQAETPAPHVPDVQEQAVTEVPAETPAGVPAEPMSEPAPVEPEPILDDLSDFDLDMGADLAPPAPEAAPAATPEAPLDIEAQLAAFDDSLGLDDSFPDLADDFDLSLADEPDPLDASFAAELDDVNAELDKLSQNLEQPSIAPHFTAEDASDLMLDEPEFDYLSGTDEAATKLDLARAYIDMGDNDGAREILDEVMKEGTETQRKEAIELRSQMS
ncbi:FimV/HubP family polar landmark protein [Pseudomonas palmensis]|jgi:pilus assembly protein FimV|uniref:FimV/HubP family polar landmark protein n=1 Tax=Pseudomonas palmensis TaxID=2815362 RepID=UPI003CF6F020